MTVPPLHHGILNTSISRIRLHEAGWHGRTVNNVQQGYGDNECAEEPIGYIDMFYFSCPYGAEEHNGVTHPGHRN